MIVVSDTSSISALLIVGEIEILSHLFGEVIIPQAVQAELAHSFQNLPFWIKIRSAKDIGLVHHFEQSVDAGEAEAIQLATELKADLLLIDDAKGRRLAQGEGLRIIGLLGVVILAKRKGLIPSARSFLSRLKSEADFFLADDIANASLLTVGE